MSIENLNVAAKVQFDNHITKYYEQPHPPIVSNNYGPNDEIRIVVQAQDSFTLPHDSSILIEGKINWVPATSDARLGKNFAAFLFQEIRYELNGVVIDSCRNVGMTSLMKGLATLTPPQARALSNAGFGFDSSNSEQNLSDLNIYDNISGEFSVKVPLKLLLGLFDDYNKIILGMRQELILHRASSDANCLVTTTAGDASSIEITRIAWYLPHMNTSDVARINLLQMIRRDDLIYMPFRSWDFHEYPSLLLTTKHIWSIGSSSMLERPRYVIVAFSENRKNNITKENYKFDNVGLKDMKLYLNGETYPYVNLNINYPKKLTSTIYDMYLKCHKSYYNKDVSDVLLSKKEFNTSYPLICFDVSRQNDSIKSASVDIKLEFETSSPPAPNTSCFCLIIHDRIVTYRALSNVVNKLST